MLKQAAYDCIVVGGHGAFGSSSAYHLAKQGAKVLAIDMHQEAHSHGSSHGQTRITRLAYAEGPAYVPVLKRSLALFKELEQRSSVELYKKTGMLDVGTTFDSALLAAKEHNLEHEILSASEVNARFPGYSVLPCSSALSRRPHGRSMLLESGAWCSSLSLHASVWTHN
jgi:sarcosine oxidase